MASKEYHRKHARDWNLAHPERVKEIAKKWQRNHLEVYRAGNLKSRRKSRAEALAKYGGKCVCCGETTFEFLSFDHIEGGGSEHRRQLKGKRIDTWLKQNNWPEGFQVLCHNCNLAKGFYGHCPHTGGKEYSGG